VNVVTEFEAIDILVQEGFDRADVRVVLDQLIDVGLDAWQPETSGCWVDNAYVERRLNTNDMTIMRLQLSEPVE